MGKNINRVRPQGVILSHGLWQHGLSLKALGLLYILLDLSQIPTWEFSLAGMVALAEQNGMGDGRDSLRTAISELEGKGFLQRQRERTEEGTLAGSQWLVSDQPMGTDGEPGSDPPTSENPTLEDRLQEGSSSNEEERGKKPPVCPPLPGLEEAIAQPVQTGAKQAKASTAAVHEATFAEFGQEAAAVLLDWWRNHKSGAKTQRALKLQLGELRQIQAMGGDALVQSQAELAIRSGVMRGKGWSQIDAAKCREYGSAGPGRPRQQRQEGLLPSQELLDIVKLAEAHPSLFSGASIANGAVEVRYSAMVRSLCGYPELSRVTMEHGFREEIEALLERVEPQPCTPF
jgi:hypothetical protein